ncbi:unnamed protein product [Aureobasidium vineae]|uniref:Uncharacterized protein n=1 Tax=Aureobasidium vineae TaxID=2773715 RepID=A0A9N8PAY7_9PEZI|nr:unnamed protein product [Aureobasidium vineae]
MSTGKEEPQVNAVPLNNEEQVFPDPQWRTGMRARFPWNGAIALLIVILCANSSLIVLLVSDNKKQKHWAEKIGPSVLLSAFNGIANIAFGVAIANGVAITWWRKALRGATIKELHRSWQFSSSIKDILLYGKYFNFIALAALSAKLTIIDGILLQKAAGVGRGDDPARNHTREFYINDTMPFTGIIGDRSGNVSTLFDTFSTDVSDWSHNEGMFGSNGFECDGICLSDVSGAGFGFDCQSEEVAMDYGAAVSQEVTAMSQSDNPSSLNVTGERTLFDITFQVIYGATGVDGDYSRIIMNLTSTNATASASNSTSCPGTVTRHSCILRPAIIRYPVTVEDTTKSADSDNPKSNLYLGYNTTYYNGQVWYTDNYTDGYYTADDQEGRKEYDVKLNQLKNHHVLSYKDILEDHSVFIENAPTVIGGFARVFKRFFEGTSTLQYSRGVWSVAQSGSADMKPFTFDMIARNGSTGCDFNFGDPLDYTIRQINLLMFAVASDAWSNGWDINNYTITKAVNVTQYSRSIHYQTNHGFMWGALASILFCVLCVLPSYWGYWQLGRDVTLGPFEIANAFRAPVLDHPSAANAPVKQLIREVGQREVKYGAMMQGDASNRLAIAEPEAVRRVHPRINDRRM